MREFFNGFKNAFVGLRTVFSEEMNFKVECVIALMVLFVSVKLKLKSDEMLWISLAIFLVLFSEILNSIIEYMMDSLGIRNMDVKKIKDVSAGLVLLTSLFTTVIGVAILGKRIFNWSGMVGFILYILYVVMFLFFSFSKLR